MVGVPGTFQVVRLLLALLKPLLPMPLVAYTLNVYAVLSDNPDTRTLPLPGPNAVPEIPVAVPLG